jgi:hypothetical protein
MSVKEVLKQVGRQMLRHFDFVIAGTCLVFALTTRPFLLSFETDKLKAAQEHFEEIHPQAQAFASAQGQPDSLVQDEKALNLYLFEKRYDNPDIRKLSDEFRSARVDLARSQRMYDMSSTVGYVFGGTFAAMGVFAAAAGVANRRPRRKENAPGM